MVGRAGVAGVGRRLGGSRRRGSVNCELGTPVGRGGPRHIRGAYEARGGGTKVGV